MVVRWRAQPPAHTQTRTYRAGHVESAEGRDEAEAQRGHARHAVVREVHDAVVVRPEGQVACGRSGGGEHKAGLLGAAKAGAAYAPRFVKASGAITMAGMLTVMRVICPILSPIIAIKNLPTSNCG